MAASHPQRARGSQPTVPELILDQAKSASGDARLREQIYRAISVQRPVVLGYLRSLRRDKPEATPAELLKELERRYVATVTTTSTGVGASAAIPGVGIPVALSLGVADLLFFYETSALYVLAVAELHGIEVSDPARAQPLVFGMLLGEKSQSKVSQIVMSAIPGGAGIDAARTQVSGALAKSLPESWGEVLTQQLPDSALAPVLTVLSREAIRTGTKLGAGTLGKTLPFGVGAVIGGLGSFTFGRDVVKAAHLAFPEAPESFPPALEQVEQEEREPREPSRAVLALQNAAAGVAGIGGELKEKAAKATEVFRSVDLDGDGVPDEARAMTAVKSAGTAAAGIARGAVGAVGEKGAKLRGKVSRRKPVDPEGRDAPEGGSSAEP